MERHFVTLTCPKSGSTLNPRVGGMGKRPVVTRQREEAGQTGTGLASLNSFSGLEGRGTVPGHLAPGPGVLGHVDSGLECETLTWGVAGGVGSGVAGLCRKVCFAAY